ncbi:hypothetical protein [Variovorax sp. KK3]|uniref:hypothetical protein n=1 Tax=Variovorax sp. KK3 TaxID=1855728 RepID=UPI00097BFA22|nr:hypothetical protein [Variovorax sp. KK3]
MYNHLFNAPAPLTRVALPTTHGESPDPHQPQPQKSWRALARVHGLEPGDRCIRNALKQIDREKEEQNKESGTRSIGVSITNIADKLTAVPDHTGMNRAINELGLPRTAVHSLAIDIESRDGVLRRFEELRHESASAERSNELDQLEGELEEYQSKIERNHDYLQLLLTGAQPAPLLLPGYGDAHRLYHNQALRIAAAAFVTFTPVAVVGILAYDQAMRRADFLHNNPGFGALAGFDPSSPTYHEDVDAVVLRNVRHYVPMAAVAALVNVVLTEVFYQVFCRQF